MIFITGPLYSGKREYARLLLGCTREELAQACSVTTLAISARAYFRISMSTWAPKVAPRTIAFSHPFIFFPRFLLSIFICPICMQPSSWKSKSKMR